MKESISPNTMLSHYRIISKLGIKLNPSFDSLKEDSRFADLVRRIGLTP